MKTIQLLEDNDIVFPTDWCRPLQIISMNGGYSDYYSFESQYTGKPENNARWCRVEQIFDTVLYDNNTVKQYNQYNEEYEFIRGEIPWKHQYGKTKPELREDYMQYLANTKMRVGKYKGKSISWIKENDDSYFKWAERVDMIKSERDFTGE